MSETATATDAAPVPPAIKPNRGRTALAVIIFVIAALIAPTSYVGAWAARTIDDTDRYVATVAPLIDSPEVRTAISDQITASLLAEVPVEQLLADVLPPRAAALAGPISNGLTSFVKSKVADALATPQARQAWTTINAELQDRLTAALKGDNTGAVTIQGDAVVLDTGTLFVKVKELLVAQGFTIFEKVPLPAAADREFVLVKSDQIQTVSTIYRIVIPLANGLMVVFLALLVAGIFVSNSRRAGVLASGWILIVMGGLVIGALNVLRAAFLADLGVPDDSWQGTTYDTVTRFLDGLGRTSLTLGVVAVLGGLIAGPSRPAAAIRNGVSRLAQAIARPLGDALPGISRTGQVIDSAKVYFGAAIIVIGALALVWGRSASAGRIVWIVVLGLLAWFVVLVLAAAGREPAAPSAVDGAGDGGESLAVGSTPDAGA